MATIKDYLRQGGDRSFGKHPFNVVDNIVLSTLAYVDLAGVAGTDKATRMADALDAVLACGDDVAPSMRAATATDAETLSLIATSARFGNAQLRDYVDEVDDGCSLQFSAMTVDVAGGPLAVIFRGTDYSLSGWRENFLLGSRITMAQHRAAAYLERVLFRAASWGRRVVVCGHSKGGNLAAYAASVCPRSLRGVIDHVWNDDGPNSAPEVAPADVATLFGSRFTRVVPERSVVGMLFLPHDGATAVVRSSASGILQHDLTTWEVTTAGSLVAGGLSDESRLVARTFAAWLAGIDLDMRETFTNEVFDALAAGNPHRLDKTLSSPAAIGRVLTAATGLSVSTRRVIRKLLGEVTSAVAGAAATSMAHAMRVAISAVRDHAAALRARRGHPVVEARAEDVGRRQGRA